MKAMLRRLAGIGVPKVAGTLRVPWPRHTECACYFFPAARLTILTLAVLALTLAGCTSSSGDKEKFYDIKGKVVSLDAEKKTVRLDHEDIPGLMPAMEMPFDVENAKILDGLKAGDPVQGKLKVKSGKNLISELHKR